MWIRQMRYQRLWQESLEEGSPVKCPDLAVEGILAVESLGEGVANHRDSAALYISHLQLLPVYHPQPLHLLECVLAKIVGKGKVLTRQLRGLQLQVHLPRVALEGYGV